jgi:Glycerophosphoryl diester phosphodiesterase family
MRRAAVLVAFTAVTAGCASADRTNAPESGPAAAPTSPPQEPPAAPTNGAPDAGAADAAAPVDGAPPANGGKGSLSICWTDATCARAMIVAHGGDWTATGPPYGSMSAVVAASAHGADAVKIDVRVTKDGVPVVSHSSPFEIYESLDCYGKRIEEMTAAQVEGCHFATAAAETYKRLGTMLAYARGKLVVQLTVKKSEDYARAIAEVLAASAQDFAFLEVSTSDVQTLLPSIPGSGQVNYLVNVGSNLAEVDTVLALRNPRLFMVEMDPSPEVAGIVGSKLHPANVRSFTYDSAATASVADLRGLFEHGFDVVSANATANDLQARAAVNAARGISPP